MNLLSEGVIVPRSSPWASTITLVTKKDRGIRFCADFRKLNSVSKTDAHPVPHVQDNSLVGATTFSTLDCKSAYWQNCSDDEGAEKTAFIKHKGLHKFRCMPFGLCNASAIFQRATNKALPPFIGKFPWFYKKMEWNWNHLNATLYSRNHIVGAH